MDNENEIERKTKHPTVHQPKVGDDDYRHPYVRFEGHPLWPLIERGISDLVDNQDLKEFEDRNYIVGYLCKVIVKGLRKPKKSVGI